MRDVKSQKFPAYLTYELFVSDAFRALKPASRDILILLFFEVDMTSKSKRGKYQPVVTNRNDIRLPYEEITKRLGYKKKAIWTAFKAMLAHGFIKVLKYGGGSKGDYKIYGISEEWRSWQPDQVIHEMETNGKIGWQKRKK